MSCSLAQVCMCVLTYTCGTFAAIIGHVEIRCDDQNFQKITFGYKIKKTHLLVTLFTVCQPPRKPECKQPSCWSSEQIEATEIIFLSVDSARGHCGGVVFICPGVKPCSSHGRIIFVVSPRKKTKNNCCFEKDPLNWP